MKDMTWKKRQKRSHRKEPCEPQRKEPYEFGRLGAAGRVRSEEAVWEPQVRVSLGLLQCLARGKRPSESLHL